MHSVIDANRKTVTAITQPYKMYIFLNIPYKKTITFYLNAKELIRLHIGNGMPTMLEDKVQYSPWKNNTKYLQWSNSVRKLNMVHGSHTPVLDPFDKLTSTILGLDCKQKFAVQQTPCKEF